MPQAPSGLYVPPGGAPEFGYQADISIPNPAAGSDLSYRVGASFYEVVLSFHALLNTDATVQTRELFLGVEDANGVALVAMPSTALQTATLQWNYNFTYTLSAPLLSTSIGLIAAPTPSIVLRPNWRIYMGVGQMPAGDRFLQGVIIVNRIPTGVELPAPLELVPTPIAL